MNKPEFCVQCPFHRVDNDKDPSDWFNDDDEVLMCKKFENTIANSSDGCIDTYNEGTPLPFKMIAGSLRPYETPKVEPPSFCPL